MYHELTSLSLSGVTHEVLEVIDAVAKKENRTRSGQIRHVLQQWAKTLSVASTCAPKPKVIIMTDKN